MLLFAMKRVSMVGSFREGAVAKRLREYACSMKFDILMHRKLLPPRGLGTSLKREADKVHAFVR